VLSVEERQRLGKEGAGEDSDQLERCRGWPRRAVQPTGVAVAAMDLAAWGKNRRRRT